MRWFGKRDWAVVIWTDGQHVFGEDRRTHDAMAVRHHPQINAATVRTDLSEKSAKREAERLNRLNDPNSRAMRIADLYADPCHD